MKTNNTPKLNPLKFALAAAIIVAFTIFITTLMAVLNFFGAFPIVTSIISDIYGSVGYSVSLTGSFLGALYSFIDTLIITYIFVWLYNKML